MELQEMAPKHDLIADESKQTQTVLLQLPSNGRASSASFRQSHTILQLLLLLLLLMLVRPRSWCRIHWIEHSILDYYMLAFSPQRDVWRGHHHTLIHDQNSTEETNATNPLPWLSTPFTRSNFEGIFLRRDERWNRVEQPSETREAEQQDWALRNEAREWNNTGNDEAKAARLIYELEANKLKEHWGGKGFCNSRPTTGARAKEGTKERTN